MSYVRVDKLFLLAGGFRQLDGSEANFCSSVEGKVRAIKEYIGEAWGGWCEQRVMEERES